MMTTQALLTRIANVEAQLIDLAREVDLLKQRLDEGKPDIRCYGTPSGDDDEHRTSAAEHLQMVDYWLEEMNASGQSVEQVEACAAAAQAELAVARFIQTGW